MDWYQLGLSEDHHSKAFVSKHDGNIILWRYCECSIAVNKECLHDSIIYSLFLPGETPVVAFVAA